MSGTLGRKPIETEEEWRTRVREYHREWRRKNPGKMAAIARKYRTVNKEKLKLKRQSEYIKNKEKITTYRQKWVNKNRDRVRGYFRKYEASHPNRKDSVKERDYRRKRYQSNPEKFREASRKKRGRNPSAYRLIRERSLRKRLSNGDCKSCGKPRMETSNLYCEYHWFYAMVTPRLGTGGRINERAKEIIKKIESQNYECAYTGRKLVPGVNASLDHIKCSSRYPELKGDISNVEWVDLKVNRMKTDMDKEEFLETCILIALRTGRVKPIE